VGLPHDLRAACATGHDSGQRRGAEVQRGDEGREQRKLRSILVGLVEDLAHVKRANNPAP
jgi:hypothetical protein